MSSHTLTAARAAAAAIAIVALLAGAGPAAASDDRAPKLLAMMSAADVLRAVRCAIPIACEPRRPVKPPRKKKETPK